MESPKTVALTIIFILGLLFCNFLMCRDIYHWVPSKKKRLTLIVMVWVFPVLGLLLANKFGNLGWFKKEKPESGQSVVSRGFMEVDAVFNPGVSHRTELIDKQKSETHHEHKQPGEGRDD